MQMVGTGTHQQPAPHGAGAPERTWAIGRGVHGRGLQYWCDVAATSAATTCLRNLRANAGTDGAATRAEEAVKRYRYHNKAVPIVVEADGRPGPNCLAFIRKFAQNCGEEHSASPARAWSAISSVLQAGNAEVELAAWGHNAFAEGRVQFYVP